MAEILNNHRLLEEYLNINPENRTICMYTCIQKIYIYIYSFTLTLICVYIYIFMNMHTRIKLSCKKSKYLKSSNFKNVHVFFASNARILERTGSQTLPRKSKDQTLPIGIRESFIWIILKAILCLVLDFQGLCFLVEEQAVKL